MNSFTMAQDLQSFIKQLEKIGQLKRIKRPISIVHEMTEIHRRVIKAKGAALLFENPLRGDGSISPIPVLVNLFGTIERVAMGLGVEVEGLPQLGETLVELCRPPTFSSLNDVWKKLPLARSVLSMRTKTRRHAACQEVVLTGAEIDLDCLPIQHCWPGEPDPLITWPLVLTRDPENENDVNVGVYRLQRLRKDRLIMRWLAQRGGAKHYRAWQNKKRDMPVAIVIGSDPALMLSAAMPLPETISEIAFSGLLRKTCTDLIPGKTVPLMIPANAEIVIEGQVSFEKLENEGPYGDHTGYYNSVEPFPVMQVSAITMRRRPVYVSTYTGRAPDEPSRIGEALNQLFIPLVKNQFPEVVDIWLPPETCSYRTIVVSINKRYPGHAKRVILSLWSMLPQFNYTKLIIAVDPDINIRNWEDVMWAISTRFDASRDTIILENMPIDYLDFASPQEGLGGKMALDATNKLPGETHRQWGKVLTMPSAIKKSVDNYWAELGL